MKTFDRFDLSNDLLKAVDALGFKEPSEIQQHSIPPLLAEDRDMIGLAQTGTGKTAAFGLPLLERIDPKDPSTQALILAPTRELCRQTAQQLQDLARFQSKVSTLPVYGGANISDQIRALKKPQQILIATPGRLIDLIERGAVKLGSIDYLVLDEADEMLDMGFKDEIDRILSYTPDEKLTWLFSATMPPAIRRIVQKFMKDPVEVKVNNKNSVNTDIDHRYALVKSSDKAEALMRLVDMDQGMRALVFCRTRKDTRNLAETLQRNGYRADALSGDLSQKQRDKVMERFRTNGLQLLVATDVAARGIDVNDLTHVFQFDPPEEVASYTHRSGRTARAGNKGVSVVLADPRDKGKLESIEKSLGIDFTHTPIPDANSIATERVEQWCQKVLKQGDQVPFDPKLLDKAEAMFADLSKEALIAKLLTQELGQEEKGGARDLNRAPEKGRKPQRPRGKNGKGDGKPKGARKRKFSKKGS